MTNYQSVIKMDLLDVMLTRRSTRKFNEDDISKEDLNRLLQAALLAPTSMNRKPCNFMVVENKETLKKLAQSKDHGAELIAGANRAIVVVADTLIADTWIEDSSIALTAPKVMFSLFWPMPITLIMLLYPHLYNFKTDVIVILSVSTISPFPL